MDHQRDYLTGLHMRAMFQERILEEVERASRYGVPLSLLVIDLDYFKSINDAYGHTRGDEVLVEFANLLKNSLRAVDLPFRYGGDEFVILLPHTPKQEAALVAQRLLHSLQMTVVPGEPPLKMSASIGVAELRECQPTAEALFERADECAYAAKLAGRGRVSVEPAAAGGKLGFDALSRLIEREEALDVLHHFLTNARDFQCSVLGILGQPGSGRSRFLKDACNSARLQGYATWLVRTGAGLRLRAFGAWGMSRPPWANLPSPAMGAETLAGAIAKNLAEHNQAGLVIAIENLVQMDRSTLEFLNALIRLQQNPSGSPLPPSPPFRLVIFFTASLEDAIPLTAALYETVLMRPFSAQGTKIWLRSVLQWEPPAAFCAWVHAASRGLPGLLEQAITKLVDQGILAPAAGSWRLREDFASFALGEQITLQESSPAGRSSSAPALPVSTLPVYSLEFFGRESDLQNVKDLLQKNQLVTLVGPGGMGKSRLAVQVGWEMLEHFPGGVFWVDLAPVTSVDFIAYAVLEGLRLPESSHLPAEMQAIQYLQTKQALLIFDNFEHLADGSAILSRFQHFLPLLKILVSSRERLGLQDEQVYELSGLQVPETLEGSSLLLLFQQSLERVPGGFTLSEVDRPYIRRIAEIVAGMPLGIELAAAWVPSLGVRGVLEEIEGKLNALSEPEQSSSARQPAAGGEAPIRQRGLRAIFDAFWHSLMPDEQAAISRLSIFHGSFLRAATQSAAGLRSFFFTALVDHFYIIPKGHGRFTIHELLRQYCEEKLRESPDHYWQACQAHARYYLSLAEKAESDLSGSDLQAGLKWVRDELDNIRGALEWSLLNQPEIAIQMVGRLRDFWSLQGMYQEGGRWVEAALVTDPEQAAPEDMARACIAAGMLQELIGDNLKAEERYRCGVELARKAGSDRLEAEGLIGLGWLLHHHGQTEQAEEALEEAMRKAQVAGIPSLTAAGLRLAASIRGFSRDYATAIRFATESLRYSRESGAPTSIARTLNLLGLMIYSAGGQMDLAHQYVKEGLEIARALNHLQMAAVCLINLSNVERKQGNLEEAENNSRQAVELFRVLNERMYIAYAEARLGMVELERGKLGLGEMHLRDSLAHAREAGIEMHALYALLGLAKWHALTGDPLYAAELLGLAFYHPKGAVPRKEVGEALLDELSACLDSADLEEALDRGRQMVFEEVVQAIYLGR